MRNLISCAPSKEIIFSSGFPLFSPARRQTSEIVRFHHLVPQSGRKGAEDVESIERGEEEGRSQDQNADREWSEAKIPLHVRDCGRSRQGPGGEFALHALEGHSEDAAVGAVVLQEGAGLQQPPLEEDEAGEEEDAERPLRYRLR